MPEANDRVAELMEEMHPRGFLETTTAQDLIEDILEAGLRSDPDLVKRLERFYREEDEENLRDGIEDTKNLIRLLSKKLGLEPPANLDEKNAEGLETLHKELFMQWDAQCEEDQRVIQHLRSELGPIVRLHLTHSIITPAALLTEAKHLWLEDVGRNPDEVEEKLSDAEEPNLSFDMVDERLYKAYIQPIVDDHATRTAE